MGKFPGAQFLGGVHPVCAQNKSLISYTVTIVRLPWKDKNI